MTASSEQNAAFLHKLIKVLLEHIKHLKERTPVKLQIKKSTFELLANELANVVDIRSTIYDLYEMDQSQEEPNQA